jgi:hypothetical protein
MVTKKQQAQADFNTLVTDGGDTPEAFVLKVMRTRGTKAMSKGMRQRFEAACVLLPYRLPRLNSIDATNRNVGMTHEEWIKSLEVGDKED